MSLYQILLRGDGEVAGVECLISRTGYTGEDGFEVYVPAAQGAEVFDALVVAGSQFGMLMCGLDVETR